MSRPSRSQMWLAGGLLLFALVPVACSDDGPDASPAPTAPSTATTASSSTSTSSDPPTSTTWPSAPGPYRSASQLAAALKCEDQVQGTVDDGPGAPKPTKNIDCHVGDAQLSVRTYASQADVDKVLTLSDPSCGYRTVGERWIVAVNTPESAIAVQQILGGRVVEFSGCRPG